MTRDAAIRLAEAVRIACLFCLDGEDPDLAAIVDSHLAQHGDAGDVQHCDAPTVGMCECGEQIRHPNDHPGQCCACFDLACGMCIECVPTAVRAAGGSR